MNAVVTAVRRMWGSDKDRGFKLAAWGLALAGFGGE
jgi:hypothetical protein